MKKYLLAILLVILVLGGAIYVRWIDSEIKVDGMFETVELSLPLYDLFDFGVVDLNDDGVLDMYSVNHSAKQTIYVGQSDSGYTDKIDVLGLSQDSNYSGLEDSVRQPLFDLPGLYIYRQNRLLHFVAHKTESLGSFDGVLELPWPVHIDSVDNVTTDIEELISNGTTTSRVSFTVGVNGSFVLNGKENIVELPHKIKITDPQLVSSVFIGQQRISPSSMPAELWWRDRHSMLWNDVDGDGQMDVYIARGGVKGKLNEVALDINDELMMQEELSFSDKLYQLPTSKYNCPARQGSWVDFDSDGDLDLYLACGRGLDLRYPNLMFERNHEGKFSEIGESLGLNFKGLSKFIWLDTDNDDDVDQLAIQDNKIIHFRNNGVGFDPETVESGLPHGYVRLTMADMDNDGYKDVYAVSRTQSRVLKNVDGKFISSAPSEYGLPVGAREANWVDYDNDGYTDLHVVPGGLYRQVKPNQFIETGLLNESESLNGISTAICNWFDMDNDGYRDVVCGIERYPPKEIRIAKKIRDKSINTRYWTEYSFRNLHSNSKNNWLEIDVRGDRNNLLSIGAKVKVVTGRQTSYSTVGQSDGAHFSQGHYRLYFGLGEAEAIDYIEINWTDGFSQVFEDVGINQLVVLRRPGV